MLTEKSQEACPLPSLCGTWWLWGGSSPPQCGRAAPTSAGLRPLKLAAPYSGNGGGPHVPLGITSPSPSPQDTLLPAAPMAAAELTPVEMAIETIVSVFVSHAGQEGRMGTLTATAFQELLRLQLQERRHVRLRLRKLLGLLAQLDGWCLRPQQQSFASPAAAALFAQLWAQA